jgi:type II secretory pathway pseudopilin PulG
MVVGISPASPKYVKAASGSETVWSRPSDRRWTMRRRQDGFAMLDVLVSLMLLAVTLTAACMTLVQTMRATHDALLTTRAVDLAADLSEQLKRPHRPEDIDTLLTEWRDRVRSTLPVVGIAPEDMASLLPFRDTEDEAAEVAEDSIHLLTLRWRGTRGQAEELRLPVVVVAGT